MIKLTFEEMISKMEQCSNHSKEEIIDLIDKKLKLLSGLISREGAAHIIANELNIKLISQNPSKEYQINDLREGMRDVTIIGNVINTYEVREFQVNSRKGKVGSLMINDATGKIRITCWGSIADTIENIKPKDIVKVTNGTIKNNNNFLELHLNEGSEIIINPAGIKIDLKKVVKRKKISEIKQNETQIEIMGVIVQIFEPKFYKICSECNKRVKEDVCENHKNSQPNHAFLMNFLIDDGTETLRIVCFKEVALSVLGIEFKEMMEIKENPNKFEKYKEELMGKQIIVEGNIRKNQMFDRFEMICEKVIEPNPDDELKRLESEV